MKRIIGALLLTIGLAALPARVANAAPDDQVRGPACADIKADARYKTDSGLPSSPLTPATVFATLKTETDVPSCVGTQYTLYVYATDGTLLAQDSVTGDGTTSTFQLEAVPSGSPEVVCAAATSVTAGRVIDQAPDNPQIGCKIGILLELNPPSGASGMR